MEVERGRHHPGRPGYGSKQPERPGPHRFAAFVRVDVRPAVDIENRISVRCGPIGFRSSGDSCPSRKIAESEPGDRNHDTDNYGGRYQPGVAPADGTDRDGQHDGHERHQAGRRGREDSDRRAAGAVETKLHCDGRDQRERALTEEPDTSEADRQPHQAIDERHVHERQAEQHPDQQLSDPHPATIDELADRRQQHRSRQRADQVGGTDLRPAEREVVDEVIDEDRHTDRLTGSGQAGSDDGERQHHPTGAWPARRSHVVGSFDDRVRQARHDIEPAHEPAVTSVGAGGCPAGAAEHVAELVSQTRGTAHVAGDGDELVVADLDRVERLDVLGQAVLDASHLGLERAEQLVPDDQDPAVVPVEVLRVGAVVDSDGVTAC